MATIPVLKRRVGPGTAQAPGLQTGGAQALAQSVAGVADVLVSTGERIQLEHDQATVRTAGNEFDAWARDQLNNHLSLKGADAKGSLATYQEAFKKQAGLFAAKFQNDRQKQAWTQYTAGRINSDLNTLAGHQRTQHQAHLNSTLDGVRASAEADVALTPTIETIERGERQIAEQYAVSRAGLDNTALIQRDQRALRATAVKTLVATDKPIEAQVLLEESRDELGGLYAGLKPIVDTAAIYKEATIRFPGDFAAQKKWAKSLPDIPDNVDRGINQRINADQAEQKSKGNEFKKQSRLQTNNSYWAAMEAKDYATALKVAQSMDVENGTFTGKERTAAISRATKAEVAESDSEAYRLMLSDVLEGDVYTSEMDVLADPRAKKLTNGNLNTLTTAYRRVNKEVEDKTVKESVRSVKSRIIQSYNRGDYGDLGKKSSKKKAQFTKADLLRGLEEFIVENPDKDPEQ